MCIIRSKCPGVWVGIRANTDSTAALVDLLVSEGVAPAKMKMMAFTDSDHSINYNGGDEWLYRYLSERLLDEVRREEGVGETHQWGKREVVEYQRGQVIQRL